MSDVVVVRVPREKMTVDRLVVSILGRHVPGVVEATLERNRGLAASIHLPVGLAVEVPMPAPSDVADAEPVVFLTD